MAQASNTLTVAEFLHRHLSTRPIAKYPRILLKPILVRPLLIAQACKAEVVFGGRQPMWDYEHDVIVMPKPSWYRSWLGLKRPRRFANDMLHEIAHWSGGARRLNRPLPREPFDPIYNREELIAELAAAILARDLGVARATMLPHARYLDGFLKTLINPEVELSAALTAANRSVGFLCSLARAELV